VDVQLDVVGLPLTCMVVLGMTDKGLALQNG